MNCLQQVLLQARKTNIDTAAAFAGLTRGFTQNKHNFVGAAGSFNGFAKSIPIVSIHDDRVFKASIAPLNVNTMRVFKVYLRFFKPFKH